jgi:hypothetical protein
MKEMYRDTTGNGRASTTDTFVYPPKQLAWIDFTTTPLFMYLVVGSGLGNVGVYEIIFISLALIFLLVPRCDLFDSSFLPYSHALLPSLFVHAFDSQTLSMNVLHRRCLAAR